MDPAPQSAVEPAPEVQPQLVQESRPALGTDRRRSPIARSPHWGMGRKFVSLSPSAKAHPFTVTPPPFRKRSGSASLLVPPPALYPWLQTISVPETVRRASYRPGAATARYGPAGSQDSE